MAQTETIKVLRKKKRWMKVNEIRALTGDCNSQINRHLRALKKFDLVEVHPLQTKENGSLSNRWRAR